MTLHERHGWLSRTLRSMRELVFGLEDGLVSTMGAVAGIAAGTADGRIVVLSGVVLIVVESLSMAAGSYLSNKSHREMLEKRIRDEKREIETKPEEEAEELRQMYLQRGFTPEETEMVVRRIVKNKELWLEEMMTKELRIGGDGLEEPKERAVVMGFAYALGGGIPVAPFLLLPVGPAVIVSVIVTLAALFAVGYWKAGVTGLNKMRSGWEMLLIAATAAGLGYLIGKVIGAAFGLTGV